MNTIIIFLCITLNILSSPLDQLLGLDKMFLSDVNRMEMISLQKINSKLIYLKDCLGDPDSPEDQKEFINSLMKDKRLKKLYEETERVAYKIIDKNDCKVS